MAKYKEYTQKLNELFANRVHWLKVAVKKVQGRSPTFTRSKIDKGIIILQNLASQILIRQIFKRDSDNLIKQKKRWHTKNKGWGRTEKKKSFDSWFKKYINYKNYVYVFWAGKDECIYVGRSIAGKTRPKNHFEKYWFNPITRIDIYSTSQKSQVPKLECLFYHRYKPKVNTNTPSKPRYSKPCPVCETSEYIKEEIKSIFKLR